MTDLFSSITPLAVFIGIASVGFLFLLVTFLLGDFDHDADVGHEVQMDHDAAGHEHGGPSFLSTRVLSVLITSFGAIGAIGLSLGLGPAVSSILGLAGGFALGWVVFVFARFLFGQQASTDISVNDLIGQTAKVTVAIPPGGFGQVRCVIGETQIERIARATDTQGIPFNESVVVEGIEEGSVIVRKVDALGGGSAVERLLREP
jgi:membrane protein implicated in regulation of membrane protease activity